MSHDSQPPSIKAKIKQAMMATPLTRRAFEVAKGVYNSLQRTSLALRCYVYDARNDLKFADWRGTGKQYWKLSSELIFQYHKLEKGLCLPGPKRFFGEIPARAVCRLMREWQSQGFPLDAPVYAAALEVLRGYRARLDMSPPPAAIAGSLIALVDERLQGLPRHDEVSTPMPVTPLGEGAFDLLQSLAVTRRSVRAFDGTPVDFSLVEKALRIAQLAPSACNRQPWRVHFYRTPETIAAMLALQNGNRGFDTTIPLLAVITADQTGFFDASERIEPALDSGLFLMSFLLALQSVGLSSCCLNWCVAPDRDRKGHAVGNIPANERIATFLAIGVAADGALVPRSARRALSDVVVMH